MQRRHIFKILNLVLFIAVVLVLLVFIEPRMEGFVIKDPDVKVIKGYQLDDFNNGDNVNDQTASLNCDKIIV